MKRLDPQHTRSSLFAFTYDAAGNITSDDTLSYKYDAAGRNVEVQSRDVTTPTQRITHLHDGDGRAVKRTETYYGGSTTPPSAYYLYSSVLGKVVTEVNAQGGKAKGYVYAGGEMVAKQQLAYGTESVSWQHVNPVTGSRATSDANRFGGVEVEADPVGIDVGVEDPFITLDTGYIEPETPALLPELGGGGCSAANPTCVSCTLDGFRMDCAELSQRMETGSVAFEYLIHDRNGFRTVQAPIMSFGGGSFWVDRWEDYTIPGRGGSAGGESDGGTTGSRNVGFFINIPGTPGSSSFGGGQRINRTPPTIAPQPVESSSQGQHGCEIQIRFEGAKSNGNNLMFPFLPVNEQNLGLKVGPDGWHYQVEVRGRVFGGNSGWSIGQTVSYTGSVTSGGITRNYSQPKRPDNPSSQFLQQPNAKGDFFFLDAPGVRRLGDDGRVTTANVIQNFTSYVNGHGLSCAVNWYQQTIVNSNGTANVFIGTGHK